MSTASFDALVIAPTTGSATFGAKVCGLTLEERARRVAVKAGAQRVKVVAGGESADELAAWVADHPDRELVVIDATDHVVHTPLVQNLRTGTSAIAVSPDDDSFAGAIVAEPGQRKTLARAAVSTTALADLAATWRNDPDHAIATKPYGELSRTPARTPAERRAAIHWLFGLIRKAQDTWLVRNFNRKVSYPFTRMLLPITALTPNIISILVFIIGAIGCVIITTPTYSAALLGASLLLFAGYLDGCDGEVARIRLESSKLGAWIDTIADEVTTILSVTCFGLHTYNKYPHDWLMIVVVVSTILATVAVGSVYFYLLTSGTGSGNSQDYPTSSPILNFLRLLIRREVINLGTFFACLFGIVDVLYTVLVIGAIVSSTILVVQQIARVASARATRAPARAP